MTEIETKKLGRPYKIDKWLPALEAVLEIHDIVFLTDEELVFLVNQTLDDKDQIDSRTFENWKAGRFHSNDETGKKFMNCIQMASIREKQSLSKRLLNADEKNWTRFAWVLERKFSEFNLKHISENINRNEQQTTIMITTGNDAQRLLIDNIINTEFEEITSLRNEKSNDNTLDDEYDF